MADITPQKTAGQPEAAFGDPLLAAQFTPPDKQKDPKFGRQLLARIYKEQSNNSTAVYFGGRQVRWAEIWAWAMGRQEMKEFVDFTSIDGDKAYVNIDYTQTRLGPQFLETLVNSIAQTETYACVSAIDDGSLTAKEQEKFNALHRMHEAQTINMMQQKAGMSLEPPNAYVPDDELMAETYFKLEYRLPHEIEGEEWLAKTMLDNEYTTLYRRIVRYEVALNCAATHVSRSEDGFVYIHNCIPQNLIFNFFQTDSGKMELSYIGEVYFLKVRELRKKYGKSAKNPNGLDEKKIFAICKSATQYNNGNKFYWDWNNSYTYAADRPYDDFGVRVFDCEIKLFDTDYYVSKVDSFGKENIVPKKGIPAPTSETATIIAKDKYTVYRGIWAMGADEMIYWGLPDVVIKPYMDISESLFSYSINIPNNDGDYVPSLFERALEPLREYQLLKLKRKQLIAEMVPAGYSIDVETARDIDLGNGNKIGWEEVVKIRNQKGVVLWSSRGLNPNEINRTPPIVEMANAGSVAQLNELNNVMDRCYQEIRSLLGVSMFRDGSDLKPRMGQAVVENQNASANNVTDFINNAARSLIQETLHKCLILHWDDQVIKNDRSDLMPVTFQVAVEMYATDYEKEQVERNIAIGMQEQMLSMKDAFYIRSIKNFKLQQLYLASTVEKNKREAQQAQQQNVEQTAKVQQESAQQAAALQMKADDIKYQRESQTKQIELTGQKELEIISGLFAIYAKGPLPEELRPLATVAISNVMLPLLAENQQLKGGLNAMANAQANQQGQPDPAQDQQMQQQ